MRFVRLASAILIGCGTPPAVTAERPAADESPAPEDVAPPAVSLAMEIAADPTLDALPAIRGAADWRRLAAASDEHAVARVEVVKLVLELGTDTLHFCQSERWPLHYDFVLHLHPEERERYPTMREFGTRNYLRDDRRYVMASVVHFVDADVWALELGPADTLDAEHIRALLERVRGAIFVGDALRFHPRSAHQLREARALDVIDLDALWAGVRFQAITTGAAVGRVVFLRGPFDPAALTGDEILVVAETPDDLPRVAALVTAELQTPLAHVAVLSETRGTPNMALRGVLEAPEWQRFEGRWARLVVEGRSYRLEPAEAAPAERAGPPTLASSPDEPCRALPLTGLGLADLGRVGAKAAQLAEVVRLGLPTAGGVVLPTSCYRAHLTRHGLTPRSAGDLTRGEELARERARIVEAPIDLVVVEALAAAAAALGSARVILRSSTNAEDLAGFSGAGLYESVVVDAHDRAALARALAEVWASVWTLRAWDERERVGIRHEDVLMAVLVQPFLDDVRALGVAITRNPYPSHREGYLVDLAPRGGSITATGEAAPEEWLLYLHSAPELVRRGPGELLLGPREAAALRTLLGTLHEALRPRLGAEVGALDVELAMRPDGGFVVLQARPYGRAD